MWKTKCKRDSFFLSFSVVVSLQQSEEGSGVICHGATTIIDEISNGEMFFY
jgi:hypothetical protein